MGGLFGKDYNKVCSFRFLRDIKFHSLFHETNFEIAEHAVDELSDFKAWFDFLTLNTNVSESFNFVSSLWGFCCRISYNASLFL